MILINGFLSIAFLRFARIFQLSIKGQQTSAITRSQLRPLSCSALGQQRVAGAIPDLRPSLDSERTTLITGVCPINCQP